MIESNVCFRWPWRIYSPTYSKALSWANVCTLQTEKSTWFYLALLLTGLLSYKVREWNWWCVKQTQSKMHKKCLETKTSSNNAKPTTFQKDYFSFLFNFHKISCSNPTEFSLRYVRYLYFELYWKNLCKETSSQATDATTKSSDQEDNEKRGNFYLFIAK